MKHFEDVFVKAFMTEEQLAEAEKVYDRAKIEYLNGLDNDPFYNDPTHDYLRDHLKDEGVFEGIDMTDIQLDNFIHSLEYYFV